MVEAGLRWIDVVLLLGYAVGLSLGQLMFKAAAGTIEGASGWAMLQRLLASPMFVGAIVLYGGLTVFWTWLLSRVPLSYAYPFVALCFVLVPAAAWIGLGERFGAGYAFGLLLILSGLLVIGLNGGR